VRAKKTSTCAVSALLRTRIDQGAPQGRFLDPTTLGGLASPDLAIGSQRVLHRFVKSTLVHEHCRGLSGRRRPYNYDFTMSPGAMQGSRNRPRRLMAAGAVEIYNDAEENESEPRS
jgi:hypothetical protein